MIDDSQLEKGTSSNFFFVCETNSSVFPFSFYKVFSCQSENKALQKGVKFCIFFFLGVIQQALTIERRSGKGKRFFFLTTTSTST